MSKLNLNHVAAISRAEMYMQPAIVPNMSPYHRKAIEDDLTRLAEVKKFLLKTIYGPGLPLTREVSEEPEPNGDTS